MEFKDIRTFIVGPNKIARPKNPYCELQQVEPEVAIWKITEWEQFEKEAISHHYALDESLTPGEYEADKVELVWQYKSPRDKMWYDIPKEWIHTHQPIEKYISSWYDETRQVLKLK